MTTWERRVGQVYSLQPAASSLLISRNGDGHRTQTGGQRIGDRGLTAGGA